MRSIVIVVVAILLLLVVTADAAPLISDVSGSVEGLSTVTISGSGFGVKNSVAPILWERFEDGTNGDALPTTGKWTKRDGVGGTFDNANAYTGSLAAHSTVEGCVTPTGDDSLCNTFADFNTSYYLLPSPVDEVYYSYVTKYEHIGTNNAGVHKNGRSGAVDSYNGAGVLSFSLNGCYFDPNGISMVSPAYPDSVYWEGPDSLGTKSPGWHRHELYKKNSIPAGAPNGAMWCNVDNDDRNIYWGNRRHSATDIVTRAAGQTFRQTSVLLGLMIANAKTGNTHKFWVDDVYVDNTQARVELCTGSTWASRIHCELQIPKTTWNDGSVIVTGNQGRLPPGTAYVYVVDSEGTANSTGYAVTVGGTAPGRTPSPPSDLYIQ